MATGNAGMLTPYEQGVESAKRRQLWEQIYDQPGEEAAAIEYRDGYFTTMDAIYEKILKGTK